MLLGKRNLLTLKSTLLLFLNKCNIITYKNNTNSNDTNKNNSDDSSSDSNYDNDNNNKSDSVKILYT